MPLMPTTDSAALTLKADTFVTHVNASLISGDLDVFDPASGQMRVQVRGVPMSMLPGSRKPDRELYSQEIWERDAQFGIEAGRQTRVPGDRLEVGKLAAHLTLFYCRRLTRQINPFEAMLMSKNRKNRKNLLNWVQKDLVPKAQTGEHHEVKDWLDDVSEDILDCNVERLDAAGSADVALMRALGRNLASITRGRESG